MLTDSVFTPEELPPSGQAACIMVSACICKSPNGKYLMRHNFKPNRLGLEKR